MNNAKTTRRALLSSVVALVLCLTMLMGTTFAWFTDTAKVSVNTITSGELDVVLYYMNEGSEWEEVTKDTKLDFIKDENAPENEKILWEPGCTYNLPTLKIVNEGNLALKYKVVITGINGDAELNEVIDWTYDGFAVDTEYNLAPEDYKEITISGHMQETANNNYQNKQIEGVSITVYATQYTAEYDSTGNTYDKNAEWPDKTEPDNVTVTAGTLDELRTVLEAALTGGSVDGVITVELEKDFDAEGKWETIQPKNYSGVNTVVINGNNHKIRNLNVPLIMGSFAGYGSITINDLTIEDADISGEGYNGLGLGAVIAYSDASGALVLNNVHVVDSKIVCTGEFAGGLVGYSSSDIDFKNCSVTNTTVTSGKSAGGIIGQDAAAGKMDGITVTDCTITSTGIDEGKMYVGSVVGTANAEASVYTNVTADTPYYGRAFVGLSINGTEYVQ